MDRSGLSMAVGEAAIAVGAGACAGCGGADIDAGTVLAASLTEPSLQGSALSTVSHI